ncbi:MAG TPA: hypothetical protein VH370_23785 [Humisphaera sp.]|jgi:hypothetical protein|nr:hypothetical protein [Humisphaera sp.]
MSIYTLYIQNGNCAGFWIQHRTWQNKCAQVNSIAGQYRGVLPGQAPNHADSAVMVSCFDIRSGRAVAASGAVDQPEDRGYVRIAQPPWYTQPMGQDLTTVA